MLHHAILSYRILQKRNKKQTTTVRVVPTILYYMSARQKSDIIYTSTFTRARLRICVCQARNRFCACHVCLVCIVCILNLLAVLGCDTRCLDSTLDRNPSLHPSIPPARAVLVHLQNRDRLEPQNPKMISSRAALQHRGILTLVTHVENRTLAFSVTCSDSIAERQTYTAESRLCFDVSPGYSDFLSSCSCSCSRLVFQESESDPPSCRVVLYHATRAAHLLTYSLVDLGAVP